ncbi:hypothetical protein Tco_0663369 [Tanacetum coccineum]
MKDMVFMSSWGILLDAVWITAAHVCVNAAQLELVLLRDFKENMLKEGPNYALMDFLSSSPSSEVSNDSICSKSCLETVELLKSQNDQLLKDLKKSELMVLVPPPYTGNFMSPTPDLSFTGLDKFVNKPIVENFKAMSSEEEPKVVRKYDDALSIEEWVSDDEEEDVSQPKTKKKTLRLSIVKKEFLKSKQQEKLLGKPLNKLSNIGKTLTVQEAIKEIRTI